MRFSPHLIRLAKGMALPLLGLWLVLLAGTGNAGILLDQPHFSRSIVPDITYFEDTDSAYTPASFTDSALIQQFTPARTSILRFGYTDSTLWLRLQIDNRQPFTQDALLYLTRPNVGLVEVYRFTPAGLIPVGSAGSQTPEVYGAVRHRAPVISLPLHPGQDNEFLLRMRSDQYLNFSLQLADPVTFYQDQQNQQLVIGIGAGIVLLLCVSALYESLLRRRLNSLNYAGYALALLLYLGSALGYLGFLWLPVPNLQTRLDALSMMLLCATALQLVRSLLDTARARPYLDLLLKLVLGLIALTMLACVLLSPRLSTEAALAVSLLAMPLSLSIVVVRMLDGSHMARYLLPGRSLILLVGLVSAQAVYAQLAFNLETTWLMLAALLLDLLLVRLGLNRQQVLQTELAEQQRRHQAVQEAERQTRTEFLSQISHEIRTPMNGILGMAELLTDSHLSPSQEDFVRTISASGNHLLKILDDILDYSKIETGRMTLDVSSFDLGMMLNECVAIFKDRAEEKRLELIAHLAADVPHQVKGDPARIRQVLANLISNAIKFTDQGEVVVEIVTDPERSPRHIRFSVTDTGAGMSREQLQHLLGQETPGPGEHQGLGLSISQQLVRMMDGEIGATSQPRKGSRFWFSIPLEADPEAQDVPLLAEQLQGLRMLVVDDNASCRLVLQQQASSWGMSVASAVNGKQALAMLHNQATLQEPFDIVLLDHEMPGMSGMELAARIREDTLIQNDPLVLMLTGLASAPSSTAARNAGIRRVIGKPVTGRLLKLTLLEELAHLRRIQTVHPHTELTVTELPSLNILVAEDHHLSQKVIKGMLARLGMRTWTVDNGRAALELVQQQPFDLILMDCEMPVMNGFEATAAIRQWEKECGRPPLPIIALTAHIMDEHKERSLNSGMNAHLSKPLELTELRDALLRWGHPLAASPSRKATG